MGTPSGHVRWRRRLNAAVHAFVDVRRVVDGLMRGWAVMGVTLALALGGGWEGLVFTVPFLTSVHLL